MKHLFNLLIYPKGKVSNLPTLTYFGSMSERISNILSFFNIEVSFMSQCKVSDLLFKVEDKISNK